MKLRALIPLAGTLTLAAALTLMAAPANAAFTNFYTSGHGDLAVGFEGGALEPHIHSDDAVINGVVRIDEEFSFEDTLVVTDAMFTRPNTDFGFFAGLGVANGQSVYWLPQGNSDATLFGVPFFGIEFEAEIGDFVGNKIDLTLVSVDSPTGLGQLSLWKDGFPPTFYFSTANGIDGSDLLTMVLGHDHYNWGFSEAGLWGVNLLATGTLVGGGVLTENFTMFVDAGATVVPLPAAGWLLLSSLGVLARFARRSRVGA